MQTPCTYARHLIFATDQQLDLLRTAERWHGDATFGITPTPWYQVYSIHAFIRVGELLTQVPLVFVLMARKRACDYRAVFLKILDLLKVEGREFPAVTEFMMDFEAAVWQVLKDVLPHVKLMGCRFHIAQAKFRKLKELGLGPLYKTDIRVKTYCRQLLSLNLLPAEKIRKRFADIKEQVQKLPDMTLLNEFCLYVENTWINSTVWPPENWSMYKQMRRTNNNVEGFHNRIKQIVNSNSPNLVKFIATLREESETINLQAKLVSQGEALSAQRKNTLDIQFHLCKLWDDYDNLQLLSKDLLEAVADLYASHNKEKFKKLMEEEAEEIVERPESP